MTPHDDRDYSLLKILSIVIIANIIRRVIVTVIKKDTDQDNRNLLLFFSKMYRTIL
jgi:hypothetical protein